MLSTHLPFSGQHQLTWVSDFFVQELAPKPILFFRFISSSDLDGSTKETDVQLSLYNNTFFVTSDSSWIADLASFAKTPEGVSPPALFHLPSPILLLFPFLTLLPCSGSSFRQAFEDVVPSEVTRISLRLEDTSIHVAAPTHPGAIVLSIGQLSLATELVSDATGKMVEA